ncbi:MAG: NAD(P)/FAD-dependent oxidoreductase [Pseudomonadota bacterium]|nr:NAD(P)/FAD-dependent oxidoreductase [Pseudomonadota bacterium]|tara:strand:- start:197 stop:2020 length:1824 start_codon:yes stop_codon:yes gene_type:complete
MATNDEVISPEVLGFDPDALAQRYAAERDKRIRADAEAQFVQLSHDSPFTNKYLEDDPYCKALDRAPLKDQREVIVIGGGWVGMLTAARLVEAGISDVRIVESGGDFGGTWYWNRYPGAQCDIESYSYLPLLEETGYVPKLRFSYASEIYEHAQRIGRHFDLYKDAVFQTWVTELRWLEDESMWLVATNRGDEMRARHVCLGTGPANRPRLPGIPGVGKFKGHSFHTCRWDYDYTGGGPDGGLTGLADKTVAIIGTGATAVQCVPALGEGAKQLYVFQRTPSSVDVRNNAETDPEWAKNLKPGWQKERQKKFGEAFLGGPIDPAFADDGWTRLTRNVTELANQTAGKVPGLLQIADFKTMEEIRGLVDDTVKDPDVAEKLKAYYNQFCKRPTFNDFYLDTFNRPNVELVDVSATQGVEAITENGIIANDKEYAVDCIVYASGFEITSSYERRLGIPIFGIGGESIYEHWREGMRTMHGLMVSGFPNLFLCGGGFVFQLGANYAHGIDVQAGHVAYTITELGSRGVKAANVSITAEERWIADQLETKGGGFVLGGSPDTCTPGYYNQEGTTQRYRDVRRETYSKGVGAYMKLLRQWREDGELEGLELN